MRYILYEDYTKNKDYLREKDTCACYLLDSDNAFVDGIRITEFPSIVSPRKYINELIRDILTERISGSVIVNDVGNECIIDATRSIGYGSVSALIRVPVSRNMIVASESVQMAANSDWIYKFREGKLLLIRHDTAGNETYVYTYKLPYTGVSMHVTCAHRRTHEAISDAISDTRNPHRLELHVTFDNGVVANHLYIYDRNMALAHVVGLKFICYEKLVLPTSGERIVIADNAWHYKSSIGIISSYYTNDPYNNTTSTYKMPFSDETLKMQGMDGFQRIHDRLKNAQKIFVRKRSDYPSEKEYTLYAEQPDFPGYFTYMCEVTLLSSITVLDGKEFVRGHRLTDVQSMYSVLKPAITPRFSAKDVNYARIKAELKQAIEFDPTDPEVIAIGDEYNRIIQSIMHVNSMDAIARYCLNDIATISNVKEKTNMKYYAFPSIRKVIFNNPATIIFWSDNTKTVVKAANEEFDPEKGMMAAIVKKVYGNEGNYYNKIKKWLPKDGGNL